MKDVLADPAVLKLTAQIVSAHVTHNTVESDRLPALIQQVYQILSTVGTEAAPVPPPTPAVPVKKSVFPDYIVCLEDGKQLKMLKRHLMTTYELTPEQYRVRWELPRDYPMIAPNYAKHRSNLAKQIGLGRKKGADKTKPSVAPPRRGRRGRRQEVATAD